MRGDEFLVKNKYAGQVIACVISKCNVLTACCQINFVMCDQVLVSKDTEHLDEQTHSKVFHYLLKLSDY